MKKARRATKKPTPPRVIAYEGSDCMTVVWTEFGEWYWCYASSKHDRPYYGPFDQETATSQARMKAGDN